MSHADTYLRTVLSDAQYDAYKAARRQDQQDSTARGHWRRLRQLIREQRRHPDALRTRRIQTARTWLRTRSYIDDNDQWINKRMP